MIGPEHDDPMDRGFPGVEYISEPRDLAFPGQWYDISDDHHFWFQWRLKAFLRQLRDLGLRLDQEARVLDIGCGTGLLGRQLEQNTAWRVDGADLNEDALKHNVKGRGRLLCYDILEVQKPLLECYDYLLLFDVLEHLAEPRPFLHACLEHLKTGGHICVNTPAIQRLFSRYDVEAGHHCRYDQASLRLLFDGLLVQILDVRFWGLSMVPLLFLRKHLMKRLDADADVISRGFVPPNKLLHGWLRLLMRLETSLITRPWLGSSLLLVARRTQD